MEAWETWELLEKAGLQNHFTEPGLAGLLGWFDESIDEEDGESYDFDPVQVCKDWKEYGVGCKCTYDDLREDYKDTLKDDTLTDEEYIEKLVEELQETQTQWIFPWNKNIILSTF